MPRHEMVFRFSRLSEARSRSVAKSASGEFHLEEEIAESSTDLAITLAIDVSALQCLYIESDQDLTIETNSSSAPDDTLAIKAASPLWWDATYAAIFGNPLSADVTMLYVTSANAATLRIWGLQDATP